MTNTIDFSVIRPPEFHLYDHQVNLVDRGQSAQTLAAQLVGPILKIDRNSILDFSCLTKDQSEWMATILAYVKGVVPTKQIRAKFPAGVHLRNLGKGRPYASTSLPWTYKDQYDLRVIVVKQIKGAYRLIEFVSDFNFNAVKLRALLSAVSVCADEANFNIDEEHLSKIVGKLSLFSRYPLKFTVSTADIPADCEYESDAAYIPIPYLGYNLLTNDPRLVQELLWTTQKLV